MPPWIFAIELGVVALYIASALDARFAIDYGDSLYADVVCAKERTLASESLVFYLFHFFLYLIIYMLLSVRKEIFSISVAKLQK